MIVIFFCNIKLSIYIYKLTLITTIEQKDYTLHLIKFDLLTIYIFLETTFTYPYIHYTMKKLLFLTFIFLPHFSLFAQLNGSLKLGLGAYEGDLYSRTDHNIDILDEVKLAFGVGVRVPFSEVLGLRAEATVFRLSGDETQFENIGHRSRGWIFNNNFLEIAAIVDWELLGKKRFGETFKPTLTPVVFGGIGLMFNNPEVNFKNSTHPNINQDKEDGGKIQLALPVGLGFKYYFSENFAFAVECGVRLPISDYYDGVSFAANASNNDSYGFGGIKGYFRIGKAGSQ